MPLPTLFLLTSFLWMLTISPMPQDGYFTKDALIGKTPPPLFGTNFKLQKEAYNAFIKMQNAALKDHIHIKVVSSFRSFNQQRSIWNSKFVKYTKAGKTPQEAIAKIITLSTIPGTSRHHWGTDIDIVDGAIKAPEADVLQAKFFESAKIYKPLKTWLDANANNFGFYLVYTKDSTRTGFDYEPWHYSYAPLSKPMLQAYLKLDLSKILQREQLNGKTYLTPEFLEAYKVSHILGINKKLKPKTNEKF